MTIELIVRCTECGFDIPTFNEVRYRKGTGPRLGDIPTDAVICIQCHHGETPFLKKVWWKITGRPRK